MPLFDLLPSMVLNLKNKIKNKLNANLMKMGKINRGYKT